MLRLGLGLAYIFIHGGPKLFGGPERWAGIGAVMGNFGIEFAPAFWGLLAACIEFFGGILLILGFFFRPACMLLLAVMLVAMSMHLSMGEGLAGASHAMKMGIIFLSLIFIGPGKRSLDERFRPGRQYGSNRS